VGVEPAIAAPANIAATRPLTVLPPDDIQQQGHTDVMDFMNQLPQNFISSNVDLANSSTPLPSAGGVATVDLRGLGPQRTFVFWRFIGPTTYDNNNTNPFLTRSTDTFPATATST